MSSVLHVETHQGAPLREKLADLRRKNPHAYPRDYAAVLGISEAELTPVFYGERAHELNDLGAILGSLSRLPRVKFMARVSYAVLEIFSKADFLSENGMFVSRSATCFVALNPAEIGKIFFLAPEKAEEKTAILLFDRSGAAALKLYIQSDEFDVALLALPAPDNEPARGSTEAVLSPLRTQHLGEFASPFVPEVNAPRLLIETAAKLRTQLAFELVTPAIAVLLVHSPEKVMDARGWFNILDADFNLHLKEESVTRISASGSAEKKMLRLENAAGESITIYSTGEK